MRTFISHYILAVLILFFVFPACKKETPGVKSGSSSNVVERDYLVKGMYCAGCVISVKMALKNAGITSDQILDVDYNKPDPDNKIGHARLRFQKSSYHGVETDCKLVKEIRNSPGYIVYWEPNNQDPCGLDTKK